MRTFFEGREYEVYGEPSPAMIAEFRQRGLGIIEDWQGELASCYEPRSVVESSMIRMRTYEGWVGSVAVGLSQEA